jgi:hypothetical protein
LVETALTRSVLAGRSSLLIEALDKDKPPPIWAFLYLVTLLCAYFDINLLFADDPLVLRPHLGCMSDNEFSTSENFY